MKAPSWIKAGHRTMLHRSWPRMVVRFTKDGLAKPKLLVPEVEFTRTEQAAGRNPDAVLAGLTKHAETEWNKLKG